MGRGVKVLVGLSVAVALTASCATIRQWMASKQMSPADKVMQQAGHAAGKADEGRKATAVNRPTRYSEDKTVIKESWSPAESTQKLARKFTDRLLDIARTKISCRYVYASKGPNTFDCSGFTSYVFGRVGMSLSSSSSQQALQGRRLGKDEPLRPGDLVFFSGRKISKTVGHVGIVVEQNSQTGEFTFIHAAITAGVEIQKSTQQYYAPRYLFARRVLPDVELVQDDCAGRDLMRTFYLVADALADGCGYDLMETDTNGMNIALFDNASWASIRSSEHPLKAATLDAMIAEYQKLYSELFPEKMEPVAEPAPAPVSNSSVQASDEVYRVKSGDSLSKIASRYHTSVDKLCELNGISPESILSIGQKIRLK